MYHQNWTTERIPKQINLHIDDSQMMTHILSNLPEVYQNILEILEDYLDDEDAPQTIKRIRDKLSEKYDWTNKQSEIKNK